MKHPLRRHRWASVGVTWDIPRGECEVTFLCRRCPNVRQRTYVGLLTLQAAQLIRRP